MARELLGAFRAIGSGLVAAPSANRFGHVSPTTAQHVRDEFGDAVMVLDGGPCDLGLESTIVDLTRGTAVLLRPGAITRTQLEEVLGAEVRARDAQAPRASGTLASHYAPRAPLSLVHGSALARADVDAAVLALGETAAGFRATVRASRDARAYGRGLYAALRELDASGAARILVERPPQTPEWEAINDRLTRAAAGGGIEDDEP
jgi:L-threonylcarbamoyladenylate synthase